MRAVHRRGRLHSVRARGASARARGARHVPAGAVERSARGSVQTVTRLGAGHSVRVGRTVFAAPLASPARVAQTFACRGRRHDNMNALTKDDARGNKIVAVIEGSKLARTKARMVESETLTKMRNLQKKMDENTVLFAANVNINKPTLRTEKLVDYVSNEDSSPGDM